MRLHFLWESLFKENIYFGVGHRHKFIEACKKQLGCTITTTAVRGSMNSITFKMEDKTERSAIVIWIAKPYDIEALYHECFHAISHILRNIGVPLCEETEEVYAYYLEYLVSWATKSKNWHKQRAKRKEKT